jgi:hypothetical protein
MEELLKDFDEILKAYNFKNYEKLNQPSHQIDLYLEKLGIDDSDLKLLYQWKNGNDLDDISKMHCQIFDFGSFLSLDSILVFQEFYSASKLWDDYFIPVISPGDGDFILFNNKKESEDYGKLHLFSVALLFIEKPISYYDSLSALIQTTIECYRCKAFTYNDEDDWLNIDVGKHRAIAEKINIQSKYWALKDDDL